MKILVTGGSGLLGSYVLRELLQAGHTVADYSRSGPKVKGAESIRGDIMDSEKLAQACHGTNAVIHLAVVPGPGRGPPGPSE